MQVAAASLETNISNSSGMISEKAFLFFCSRAQEQQLLLGTQLASQEATCGGCLLPAIWLSRDGPGSWVLESRTFCRKVAQCETTGGRAEQGERKRKGRAVVREGEGSRWRGFSVSGWMEVGGRDCRWCVWVLVWSRTHKVPKFRIMRRHVTENSDSVVRTFSPRCEIRLVLNTPPHHRKTRWSPISSLATSHMHILITLILTCWNILQNVSPSILPEQSTCPHFHTLPQ
jgi:hypothetical protein